MYELQQELRSWERKVEIAEMASKKARQASTKQAVARAQQAQSQLSRASQPSKGLLSPVPF
jgi:hypothetical protein